MYSKWWEIIHIYVLVWIDTLICVNDIWGTMNNQITFPLLIPDDHSEKNTTSHQEGSNIYSLSLVINWYRNWDANCKVV